LGRDIGSMSHDAISSLSDASSFADVLAELPWLVGALECVGELESVQVESMSSAGGLNAEMNRLCVTFKDAR
jgi:hypothetical protein